MYTVVHLSQPQRFRSGRIIAIPLSCMLCICAFAQRPNPNYTDDMPSVDRVKAEIKGSDPTDTLARQVAVFTYLSTYIQRIKYNRSIDGPYTPAEQRVMGAYDLARYQISQDFAKSHTPAETQAFQRLEGQYEFNTEFNKDWNKRLMGVQSKAEVQRTSDELGARQAAHVESIKRANEEANKASADLSADPTAVATRRCLELGGAPTACMTKGFKSGMLEMIGLNLESITGPGHAGLVFSGRYRDPRASTSLNFTGTTLTISGCGKLVENGRGYSITKGTNSLVVTVTNEPRHLVFTTRPDGSLLGPGLVDVTGSVITGYHMMTRTLYANGSPVVDNSCGGVCSQNISVADYAPKTERCAFGSLGPPPAQKQTQTSGGFDAGIVGALMGVVDTGPPPPPGLRMTGKYTGSGLQFEFSENSVILDCGRAHVRAPYTVEDASGDVRIHVQNSGGPFTLALLPNNTLRGSGSATINGRLVTGMQGENVTYAPHNESCAIGTYTPATADAADAPPVSSAPSDGSARLLISSAFPTGPNPLVGKTIFLQKDTLPNVLKKVGVSVKPGATAGEALRAMATSCRANGGCADKDKAIEPFIAGRAVLDRTGRAAIAPTVPPGRYFVSGFMRRGDSLWVWDVEVNLKPGDNSVVLGQNNVETVE